MLLWFNIWAVPRLVGLHYCPLCHSVKMLTSTIKRITIRGFELPLDPSNRFKLTDGSSLAPFLCIFSRDTQPVLQAKHFIDGFWQALNITQIIMKRYFRGLLLLLMWRTYTLQPLEHLLYGWKYPDNSQQGGVVTASGSRQLMNSHR